MFPTERVLSSLPGVLSSLLSGTVFPRALSSLAPDRALGSLPGVLGSLLSGTVFPRALGSPPSVLRRLSSCRADSSSR